MSHDGIDEQSRFRVTAPLGMTTRDATGRETDRAPGSLVTFAQLNTAVRHIRTLLRVGDLTLLPPAAPPPKETADAVADR